MMEEDIDDHGKVQREEPGILTILAAIVGEDDLPYYDADLSPEERFRQLEAFSFKAPIHRGKGMKKTILISSFLAAMVAMTPAPSRAWDGCCPPETSAITGAIGSTTAAVTAQTAIIAGAIAQSGNAQKKAAVDATAKAADQAAQDAAVMSNQHAQQRASEMFQIPPDGCKSVAHAGSVIKAREAAGQVSRQNSRDTVDKKFQGDRSNPKADPGVSLQLATKLHQEKYCTAEEAARGLCSQARNGYDGADLQSETILKGAGAASAAPLSFNADQLEAAKAYMNNVVTLTPPPILARPEDEQTPQGQMYLAAKNSRHAQISLAAKPFTDTIADRTPQQGLRANMEQIWLEMQGSGFEPPPNYNPAGGEISPAFYRQMEVDRRAGNPAWHVSVAAAMPDAVSKEQTYILALMASQQQQILQRLEQLTLILAAQYAETTKAQDATLQSRYTAAVGSSRQRTTR